MTDESQIVANAAAANDAGSRLFCFGVGYDVNARLLDKLSGGGRGTSVYVRPNEDIEAAVAELFGKIASPALTDPEVTITPAKKPSPGEPDGISRVMPRALPDLFHGEQLVLVGRYSRPGPHTVTLSGTSTVGDSRGGGDDERQTFTLAADLPATTDGSTAFVETLWATRRIGELIAELDTQGRNQELIDELVALSTKHGILTPYTAFLAEEDVRLDDLARNNARGLAEAEVQLGRVSGMDGVEQRRFKAELQQSERGASADSLQNGYLLDPSSGTNPVSSSRTTPPARQSAGGLDGGDWLGSGSLPQLRRSRPPAILCD